jgi:hypothetical protein
MKRLREDPNQTLINWGNPAAPAVTTKARFPDPVKLVREQPAPLVQYLPWDFTTTFPQPTDEAIDAGIVHDTDVLPENLKSLHENYTRQCLATLEQLDKVMDARRKGIDPGTGQKPRTHASRERLRKYLAEEPGRLEHTFSILIETYENAFGPEAAQAFAKFIRARHAGIPVQVEGAIVAEPVKPKRRAPIVLPVPKPLAEAIARGDFGQEEGKPVNPSPREVRAITENHVEKIIDLMDGLRQVERQFVGHCSDRARVGAECNRLKKEVRVGIEKYAASFGTEAGERLEAYCRRQLLTEQRSR